MKSIVEFEILDATTVRTSSFNKDVIGPCLSYKKVIWRQGQYRREKKEYIKYVFRKQKQSIFFGTGLLPRVKSFLTEQKIPFKVIDRNKMIVPGSLSRIKELIDSKGKKIILRDDQMEAVSIALRQQRGIIKAATGIGKSYILLGIIKALDKTENVLVLCHTTSIIQQLYDEFKLHFKSIKMLGGAADPDEKYKDFEKRIVLSTIQSFAKINPANYCDYFSAVFIDEAHRLSSLEGEYGIVLSNLLAPMRIGFTATPPTAMEAIFAYESLVGPVIYEFTVNEAATQNILARPRIKIIKAGHPPGLRDIRDYHTVYYEGIVANKSRNKQIVSIIQDIVHNEETVLTFVNKIEHGNNLIDLANEIGLELVFVQGSSTTEVREHVKQELKSGVTKAVIATSVWKEGVDIPGLNNLINAGGGKSEIATLQTVGRGLRRTDKKKDVVIYDFFDGGHPYLISHFGDRITLYSENNWL